MSPQDLIQLGRLAAESESAANSYVDELLSAWPRHADGSAVGIWLPSWSETPTALNDQRDVPHAQQQLAAMLVRAGVGPRLRAARLAGINFARRAPDGVSHRDDDFTWLQPAEQDSTADPDVQAMACLRLLDFHGLTTASPGIRQLVQMQLSELLVTYPALLHPRIGFVLKRNSSVHGPLAMALLETGAALPSSLDGIDLPRLQAFWMHPILHRALAKPSTRKSTSLLQQLSTAVTTSARLVVSLLEIERTHKDATGDSLLRRRERDTRAVFHYAGEALQPYWLEIATVDPIRSLEMAALIDQLRQSDLSTISEAVFAGCFDIVVAIPEEVDVQQPSRRITRLIDLIETSGLSTPRAGAATVLASFLFDDENSMIDGRLRLVASHASAKAVLEALETAGADFAWMAKTIERRMSDDTPLWRYVTTETNRRAMVKAMDASETRSTPLQPRVAAAPRMRHL